MNAKLRYFLLFIACLIAPSSTVWSDPIPQDSITMLSPWVSGLDDSRCLRYICADGVSIAQFQRIERNFKTSQSTCPAPSPANVDFVVILTHDVNFYNYTLPVPIHTDSSGLSDWSPIVRLESAHPSEKYKREYVWVFRFKRGTFDPGHFSPDTKPNYSEVESGAHASDRAVDAAFKFIDSQRQ
jgi:hypothetical protein